MLRSTLFLVFLTWTSAHSGKLGSRVGSFPCPDATAILPCVCSSSGSTMNLDCSKVISDNQLATVFHADFPASKFHQFTIGHNLYIQKLSNIFRGKSFSVVEIYNTTLHTVAESTFDDSLETLTSLNIADSSISNGGFAMQLWKFPHLAGVYLSGNTLTSAPLVNSSSIVNAFFDKNRIESLDAGFTKQTMNLTEISLRGNSLTSLVAHSFDLPTHSVNIELKDNQIKSVAKNAFALPSDTKELKLYISLANNNITTLDESVYGPVFPFMTSIDLDYNPLECGCDIAWIVLKTSYLYRVSYDTRCADGRRFRTLDPNPYEELCEIYP